MKFTFKILIAVICILGARAEAESCPDFADQRLISLVDSMALVAEQIDAASLKRTEALARQAQTLRALASDRDPGVLEAACEVLTAFPSMENALAESAQLLADRAVQGWLGDVYATSTDRASRRRCLKGSEYQSIRGVVTVLRSLDAALQSFCDSMSCLTGICRICLISGVTAGIVIPPLEAGLAVDGLFCSTQHADDMKAYCNFPNGSCPDTRNSVETLGEIEQLLTGPVISTLQSVDASVATRESLGNTRALLDERFDRTGKQLSSLETRIADDAQRRESFQADLVTLDIEASLSVPVDSVAIDLQLPAAFGGRLETVREVVADAIVASTRAGIETGAALALLRQGDGLLNEGDYAPAFNAYRSAYQELVR